MQRLAPSVRSALLSDTAAPAQASVRRWSLRSLANINDPSQPQGGVGGLGKVRGSPPRADVAETLLNDVRLRLALQHSRTVEMAEQAAAIAGRPTTDGGKPREAQPQAHAGNGNHRPRKVRAVNSPVNASLKLQLFHFEQARLEEKSALRNLADLEVLHADTYKLIHDLLDGGAPTLRRWSPADRALVAATFESLRSRHASSVETLADAVIGLRRSRSLKAGRGYDPSGQYCGIDLALIDSYLRSRLGVQLLCDHYVGLDKGKPTGGISVGCDLGAVVEDAVTEARHVCDANLGTAPDVVVRHGMVGCPGLPRGLEGMVDQTLSSSEGCINVTLIRPWLHHSLVEILKNAMASSVQRAAYCDREERVSPPDVHVRLVDGLDSVSVVVMDQGVGLTEERARRAFKFAETSSLKRWDRIEEQTSYAMVRAPLGSLGVGLPLSRMMMQMFGGDAMLSNRAEGGGLEAGCTAVVKLLRDDAFVEGEAPTSIVTDTGGILLEQA